MKRFLLRFISYETAERMKTVAAGVLYWSGVASLLGRANRRGAAILMFHSVGSDRTFSDNRLPARLFEETIAYLKREWEIVPLSRIVEAIKEGREPSSRWVALTFDDGYADNKTVALPILKKYGAVASFYPTVNVLDDSPGAPYHLFYDAIEHMVMNAPGGRPVSVPGVATRVERSSHAAREESVRRLIFEIRSQTPDVWGRVVADLSRALGAAPSEERIYMRWEDVRALEAEGMGIGSHTLNHACLAALPRERMKVEITDSKRRLDERLSQPVRGLAFPFGKRYAVPADAGPDLAAAGYDHALTTHFGRVTAATDPFALPRISVEDASLVRLKVALSGVGL